LFSILFALAYCFSLVLAQGAATYLSSVDHLTVAERTKVTNVYGSVFLTMYSLFKSMTGGRNWGEIADLIQPAGYIYSALIALYIFINLFSVLNVVNGVFVDGAIELGKRDRNMMIRKQGQKREASSQHLVELLRDMDTEGHGFITRDEFMRGMHRYEVREFMRALSIDLKDADKMYSLLDRNNDGMVDIVEFVQGMEKMRGEAKSSDIHFLMMQCEVIAETLRGMQGHPAPEPYTYGSECSTRSAFEQAGCQTKMAPARPAQDPSWDLAYCDLGAIVAQKQRRISERRRSSQHSQR